MEWLRDEYLAYVRGEAAERPMFVELFGPLVGLDREWLTQGATASELDLTAFGFDYVRRHGVAVNTGLFGGQEGRVLEENSEHVISLDRYGRRMKLCKASATIPLPLDHPVRDMASWEVFKPHYRYSAGRFAADWLERARQAREAGALIVLHIPGGFDEPRQLLGEEVLCTAFYEQPELVDDILQTIGATCERIVEEVTRQVPVDCLSIHEDLAGKSGPLVGPRQINRFLRPYYRRCWDIVSARGGRLFQQDSDGNMNSVLEAFQSAGVNSMLPMEPAAGMDIVQVHRQHPGLTLMGGIDKHVLRGTTADIDRELEYKLQPAMQRGGVVFGLDHRIPNGTPVTNYRHYVRRARELLGLESKPTPGWQRMAF